MTRWRQKDVPTKPPEKLRLPSRAARNRARRESEPAVPRPKEICMDPDRIEGVAKDVAGKVTEIAGEAVGHEKTRADGVGLQIEGKAQNLYGQAKDGAREFGDRAEDALRQTDGLADRAIAEGKR